MFDIHRKCRYFKFCQGLQRCHDNVAENSKIFSTHFTKKMFGKGVGGVIGVYMKLKKSHFLVTLRDVETSVMSRVFCTFSRL